MAGSIFVRLTDGRDRGRKIDMVYLTAQEMIQDGRAVMVDPNAEDFIPDFKLPRAAELNPQAQLRQVESLSQARTPEVPTILAGSFSRKRRNN
jgi:hypothetical protein